MSANEGIPHILIIPEDKEDRAIVVGAVNALNINAHIVSNSGGWLKVETLLNKEYIPRLRTNANTHVVIVIDFDKWGKKRYEKVFSWVPSELKDRVFILGPAKEPKDLRSELKLKMSLEEIGETLVTDCDEEHISPLWDREMLKHNKEEFRRLRDTIGLRLLDYWTPNRTNF